MLSSTMVSVLAPNWNSRLRRTKRGVATGDLEVQGNSQDVTYGPNTEANSPHEQFLETQSQHGGERGLRDVSQAQLRASFLGTGRNIVGWSTKSGPPSLNLDYESKRKVVQSVSLDVNSDRLDNRKTDGGAFSPVAMTAPPLSLDLNGQGRMPQASHQGELSHSSSKPTTSSRLFSLRGLNSSWRSSLSETNPLSVTSSTSDRAAEFFTPHLSPTLLNNNEQERLTSLPYSSSISYRTTETGPILSPSFPNHREGDLSKTPLFPASPKNKDSGDAPFSQLSQTTRTQTTLSCPKQTFLTRGLSERQQNYKGSDKRTDHMSESSLSPPRLSPYDRYAFLKSQSLPRRTTLTSTSWWKQVTQEGTSPLSLNDTTNIKNKNETSTPLVTPCNNNSDLASRSPIDNKRFSSQIPNNRDNNNTAESAYKGNLNIVLKTQGGAHILRRSNAEDTPDQESDRLFKQQHGTNLNDREPQKPHSLPSVSSSSKFSSAAGQTTLSHPKDLSKPDVSNSSFKANVTELQLTSLNPKSPNTSTESTNNYKNLHYTTKTNNNTPTTPHSFRDSYKLYPLSLDSSKAMDQDTKSQLKLNSSLSTSQGTSEKNDLTANTKPSPALFIPPSTSSPTTTNVKLSKTTSCTDQAEKQTEKSVTFTKQSLSQDATNALNSQALSLKVVSGPLPSSNTKASSSSNTQSVSSQTSIPSVSHTGSVPHPLSTKFTKTATATPLGFERSYASIPKSLHPKTISTLVPTSHVMLPPKTNYSAVSTSSTSPTTSATTLSSRPAPTTPTIPSLLTPPITPALTSSATTVTSSSLLTPPATPTFTRPVSPETSLRQVERTFSGSLDLTPKKQLPRVEGRRVRRVTWQDSVDLQRSEATMAQRSEPPQTPTSPISPSRTPGSVVYPSIFSFLRLGSPTGTTSPLCSPIPKTSTIQVWRGGKHQGVLSSDSADQASREGGRAHTRAIDSPSQFSFDHGGRDSTSPRHERKLSEEVSPDHCRSAAPLSLPPDFSSGYKLRYSSTPYSTLKSTRSTQGEAKNIAPTSTLFQQTSLPSKSIYTVPLSLRPDHITSSKSKLPLSPINSPQPLSPHFQKRTGLQESSKFVVSETDHANNNHCKHSGQDGQNGQMSLVNNRVDISSQPPLLQADKALGSPSTCVNVIETLVYNISTADSTNALDGTPKPLMQHTANTHVSVETKFSRQPYITQSRKVIGNPQCQSNQSSNGSSSKENQCPSTARADDGCSNRRMKESVIGKSRFFSLESKNEIPPSQSPRRGLFALKKSVSTPNSSLHANKETPFSPDKARPETERANKSGNKVDQVLSKLRQTFSGRRSDDDLLFSWRWKRPSQTPSVSGSSDISDVSDSTVESNKTVEEEKEREKGEVGRDSDTGIQERDRWTENRYTLTPPLAVGNRMARDQFSIWSDKTTINSDQNKHSVFEGFQKDKSVFAKEQDSESKIQAHLTSCRPTRHQFDFYKDDRADYKPTNRSPSHRDPSPARQQSWSPNHSTTQCSKSTPSPRSPFSPFSSLSPVSPFPTADATEDSVFYSPKPQRRGESTCSCEQGEGISLVDSTRSRASTAPSSGGQCQDKERLASYSSCADIKYGIEARRSFSVSSVLSSRPSGPGRISTGSRFMSVSDLSDPAVTFGGHSPSSSGMGLDQWSVRSDQTSKYDYRTTGGDRLSSVPSDPGKMRSRSLPRSLTRCLANRSSEVTAPPPVTTTTTKPGRLWSPNLDTYHFVWDTEGPPTPPPSPPLSPTSRRISKPPSLSSPSSPSSPGASQGSQSPRGHLPSKGYVSSLSAFEESSDSSSDTTTDDEYYLETGGDEKETEL
ncbi:uncharacterized protein LOC139918774 [Centroberyx gerrardi]